MGITGLKQPLLEYLKKKQYSDSIDSLRNLVLGVDLSIWLNRTIANLNPIPNKVQNGVFVGPRGGMNKEKKNRKVSRIQQHQQQELFFLLVTGYWISNMGMSHKRIKIPMIMYMCHAIHALAT